ncbi:MAG: hypothetical protein KKE02_16020 [Alphaproteobacteria bacterium]|nr:hypothetical protein [Alphaproteobacteria bacterium]MBU1516988.1 hypothetical protein [Alphaproteobacteria bacterium]MBU2094974.1 hypothetical protein [Alphaproteobacteria bacterium]MBU2152529.1 hypothetical protein [Alphaproteobacteria bacterium]MBU2308645.1 hypothetical protein [Alphaproteobacteria bacterium]
MTKLKPTDRKRPGRFAAEAHKVEALDNLGTADSAFEMVGRSLPEHSEYGDD